jgi:3-phenylpropionate/trans-cinnamate dioxygenase ferredoxin component
MLSRAGIPASFQASPTAILKTDRMSRTFVDICPVEELPLGAKRVVEWEDLEIGVVNCRGDVLAIEDRCSHDDGDLMEGEVDDDDCTVECPRHGSVFDLRTGKPLNLPAYVPVDTFPVSVADGMIRVEVD